MTTINLTFESATNVRGVRGVDIHRHVIKMSSYLALKYLNLGLRRRRFSNTSPLAVAGFVGTPDA